MDCQCISAVGSAPTVGWLLQIAMECGVPKISLIIEKAEEDDEEDEDNGEKPP